MRAVFYHCRAAGTKGRAFIMKFWSVIKKIGHDAAVVVGIADKVEQNPLVQGLESMFIPSAAVKLTAAALHAVAGATTITAKAASSNMTGAQKMAVALAAFEQVYNDHCAEIGVPPIPGEAENILQKAYDLLDVLPAKLPTTVAAAAADAATLAAPAAAVVTAAAPSAAPVAAKVVAAAELAPAVVAVVEAAAVPAADPGTGAAVILAGPGLHSQFAS